LSLKRVIEVMDLLDSPAADGPRLVEYLDSLNDEGIGQLEYTTVEGEKGSTDFVRLELSGSDGKSTGGAAPTLGVVGRLGGVGARPERLGLVSDADGAIVALALAAAMLSAASRGDRLSGDLIVGTHVCPNSPTIPHEPVPFMGAPVDMSVMNRHEVAGEPDAILSIDATKGNRIINTRGFAITPTVKEGYILRVSDGLLDIMSYVTGRSPVVLPITTQDITPYGPDIWHINSIMQPATATPAPVVGVALTADAAVPGCATGASHPTDLEEAVRFCAETAKAFSAGTVAFFDADEFQRLLELYGPLDHLVALPARPDPEEE
jgi:hypothetical protein